MEVASMPVPPFSDKVVEGGVPPSSADVDSSFVVPASSDEYYNRLRSEALVASSSEPSVMSCLLSRTILHPSVRTFEGAVASAIAHRLSAAFGGGGQATPDVCPLALRKLFEEALTDPTAIEMGHTAAEAIRADAEAHVDRDPACETLLEAVLFFKGYAAVVSHRVARRCWLSQSTPSAEASRFTALWIQSQASAAFGVDIHPGANVGSGVMIDHATGVVVGETASIGDGCTILHGVTLGGTGKDSGDRHPKVGRDVLIGANASVLGNIRIGDGAKIGAGSVVLRPVPHGATAVGSPAKIIGWAKEKAPGSKVDQLLVNVVQAGHKEGGGDDSGGTGTKLPALGSTRTESTSSLTTVESEVSGASSLSPEEASEEEEGGSENGEKRAAEEHNQQQEQKETRAAQVKEEATEPKKPSDAPDETPPPEPAPDDGQDRRPSRHKISFVDVRPPTSRHRSVSYDHSAAYAKKRSDPPSPPRIPRQISAKTLEDLPDDDCLSPFREFRLRPKRIPPGCVTYCSLRSLLRSASASSQTLSVPPDTNGTTEDKVDDEGGDGKGGAGEGVASAEAAAPVVRVTDDEVGEVFFELLRRTGRPERRYVPRSDFERDFPEVASKFVGGLSEGQCREMPMKMWMEGRMKGCKGARGRGGAGGGKNSCPLEEADEGAGEGGEEGGRSRAS